MNATVCEHPEELPMGDLDNDGGEVVRCSDCGLLSNIGVPG